MADQAVSGNILAVSFDAISSPSINVNFSKDIHDNSHGWGFGWYPNDQKSVTITKEPVASNAKILLDALIEWSSFRSTVFFFKTHVKKEGRDQKETQPFSWNFAGREWMFMHNGHLDKEELKKLNSEKSGFLEPLGSTDSELAFCHLLSLLQEGNYRTLADIDPKILLSWFYKFDNMGGADMSITDGDSVVCFQGSQSQKQLYHTRIQPPNNMGIYELGSTQLVLDDPRDTYRTALVVSSQPVSGCESIKMFAGQMIIVRRGSIIWDSSLEHDSDNQNLNDLTLEAEPARQDQDDHKHIINVRAMSKSADGSPLEYRTFEVSHITNYEYSQPVEHSTHFFKLHPTDDPIQETVSSKISISSPSEKIQYEDVFGNQTIHCIISQPYSKLTVEAISTVKIFATPPDDHSLSSRRTSIPLSWMPWQRQMMTPYLLPAELPESQLQELTEYAMSFVERNDYNLLKTIQDINLTIYKDYQYVQRITSLNTTPFDVYTSRKGVCQDFANLFICLARLLGIPARYRMGYLYTGVNYVNKVQAEESHAWAEVYMPFVGWRGFDPTNGCTVLQDHIRIACGRNYRDATPTSGTIYKGGGKETLNTHVTVKEINQS